MRTPVIDAIRPTVHALCRAWFRLEHRGVEHIPPSGPLIVAPNHQTYADPALVSIPIRRRVHYMAWNALFDVPGLAWTIRRLRAFPVDTGSTDARAVRHAIRLLRAGHVLMVFPEGERSRDGTVGRFKPGAFRLAVSAGVPVLPVTISGGHESWPPGRLFPRAGRVTITYHRPLRPPAGADPRQASHELSERARSVIQGALERSVAPARLSTP